MPCGGQRFEIEGAGRRRPLGEHHAALLVECDLGNLSRACTRRHGDLKRCVVAERAIGAEPDRPNLQAGGDRVIEAMLVNREAEEAALRRGIIPCRRLGAVELSGW